MLDRFKLSNRNSAQPTYSKIVRRTVNRLKRVERYDLFILTPHVWLSKCELKLVICLINVKINVSFKQVFDILLIYLCFLVLWL